MLVANRTRTRTRALGAHFEHAERIRACDRSAAVTDRGDGDGWDVDLMIADIFACRVLRFTSDDQRDIRGRSADIEAHDVLQVAKLRDPAGADPAHCGASQYDLDTSSLPS